MVRTAHLLLPEEKMQLAEVATLVLLLNTNRVGEGFYRMELDEDKAVSLSTLPFVISSARF